MAPGKSCEIITPRPPPSKLAMETCGKMVQTPAIRWAMPTSSMSVVVSQRRIRGADPLMGAPGVVQRLVEHVGAERVPVQDRQVVEVHVAVVGDLPVGAVDNPAFEEVPVGEIEVLQDVVVAGKEVVYVQVGVRIEMHPDEPRPLRGWQFDQAVAGPVHGAKVLFREDPHQGAALVVGPGVVGAGETLRAAGAGRHDLRAPVAAHVHEGAHPAVLAPGDEYRGIHRIHGLVVARVRNLGCRRQHQRHALEDPVHFLAPALLVEVVPGRLQVNGFRLFDGSGPGRVPGFPWPFQSSACGSLLTPTFPARDYCRLP